MSALNRLARLACVALLLAWQGAQADATPGVEWAVRLPQPAPVVFKGVADLNGVGQPGAMMYPAAGVAGLVVGIVTHGLVASAMLDHQKTEVEKQADKVLAPSLGDLALFTQQELMAAALAQSGVKGARMLPAGAQAGREWTLQSVPVYSMTQDRTALILENSIAIYKPGTAADQPSYQNTVRIVSRVHEAPDMAAYWSAEQSKALKEESERLMARSLDIAVADATAGHPAAGQVRTVRYAQGKDKAFERAEVLNEQCGRALIRTLRGWLMSVPLLAASEPAGEGCGAVAQN